MFKTNYINAKLDKNNIIYVHVNGSSMKPLLQHGDKVVIINNTKPKLLDICLFRKNNKYILHRLINIDGNKYILKGDNNSFRECINESQILGVLFGYYKGNKFIEINDNINKRYYYLSKLLFPITFIKSYIKKIIGKNSKSFVINVAELNIKINNKYDYINKMCKDYIVDSCEDLDMDIFYTEKEIRDYHDSSSNEFKEFCLAHEKIAKQLYMFNRVLIHGATVSFCDDAFLFTGESGIGKSTHIKLLMDNYKNIEIVNGDKPIIDDDGFIYGTPWAGKENWQKNVKKRLKSVIFVNRDKYNHIEKIEKKDCLKKIIDQVYTENELNEVLDILDKSLKNVTFYNLFCTVDKEAAELSFNNIINK